MNARRLAAIALVVLAGGCARATASSPDPSQGAGRIVVTQESVRPGPAYIEGYVPFVTVEQDGHEVFSARMKFDQALSRELAAGSYHLTFTVRPCDANCGNLDRPAETCSATFVVASGQTVKAHVVERPAEGCSISFQG